MPIMHVADTPQYVPAQTTSFGEIVKAVIILFILLLMVQKLQEAFATNIKEQ